MVKYIKFATRPNLKYPLQYLIYSVLRDTESTLFIMYLNYNDSLLLTPLMFINEFLGGLIVYLYQKKFVKKTDLKDACPNQLVNVILQKRKKPIKSVDSKTKIIFMIFCSTLFDFIQFVLSINTPKFINVSSSINTRLGGFLIIIAPYFIILC